MRGLPRFYQTSKSIVQVYAANDGEPDGSILGSLQAKRPRLNMGLLKTLFTNCAHPKGQMGRAMLKFMNLCHAPLTNWGLSLVDIQDGWTMLDIGCGGGATLQRLLKRSQDAKVYGIDISEESVAKARQINADVLVTKTATMVDNAATQELVARL